MLNYGFSGCPSCAKREVAGKCYDYHGQEDSIDFFGEIVRTYLDKELHPIVDNLSVHRHKEIKKWLEKRREESIFTSHALMPLC